MLTPEQLAELDKQYICGELKMYQVCSLLEHAHAQQARISELEQKLAALETWSEEDKPLPEDADIEAAHPLSTGRHDIYTEAVNIVGAKRSKFALVALVNWLLVRADVAEQDAARYRWLRDPEQCESPGDYLNIAFEQMDAAIDAYMK